MGAAGGSRGWRPRRLARGMTLHVVEPGQRGRACRGRGPSSGLAEAVRSGVDAATVRSRSARDRPGTGTGAAGLPGAASRSARAAGKRAGAVVGSMRARNAGCSPLNVGHRSPVSHRRAAAVVDNRPRGQGGVGSAKGPRGVGPLRGPVTCRALRFWGTSPSFRSVLASDERSVSAAGGELRVDHRFDGGQGVSIEPGRDEL